MAVRRLADGDGSEKVGDKVRRGAGDRRRPHVEEFADGIRLFIVATRWWRSAVADAVNSFRGLGTQVPMT